MPPTSLYYVIGGALAGIGVHWWLLNRREQSPRWARRTAAALVGLALTAVAVWLFVNPSDEGLNRAALDQHIWPTTAAEIQALAPGSRVIVTGHFAHNRPLDVLEWTSNDAMPDFIAYTVYQYIAFDVPDEQVSHNFPELQLQLSSGSLVTLAPAPESALVVQNTDRSFDAWSFNQYYNTSPKVYGYTNGDTVTVVADLLDDGRLAPVFFAWDWYWSYLPGWDAWHIGQNVGLGFVGLVLFLLALVAEFPQRTADDDPNQQL